MIQLSLQKCLESLGTILIIYMPKCPNQVLSYPHPKSIKVSLSHGIQELVRQRETFHLFSFFTSPSHQASSRFCKKTVWRIKTTDERTDHLPICNQTKLYLKNGIEIDRHKSHLYQSTLIDETATKVYPLSPSSLKSKEKIHTLESKFGGAWSQIR